MIIIIYRKIWILFYCEMQCVQLAKTNEEWHPVLRRDDRWGSYRVLSRAIIRVYQ